jgi:hypothetical protein
MTIEEMESLKRTKRTLLACKRFDIVDIQKNRSEMHERFFTTKSNFYFSEKHEQPEIAMCSECIVMIWEMSLHKAVERVCVGALWEDAGCMGLSAAVYRRLQAEVKIFFKFKH